MTDTQPLGNPKTWQVRALEAIRADLEEGIKRLRARSTSGQILPTRGVLGGKPAIAGTRITPAAVQRMLRAGWTMDRITVEYPELTAEDIQAADRPATATG